MNRKINQGMQLRL
ncbi:hypothetical protein PENVUL_c323G07959 [Penicillium vulpinum]|uniref:Uncharacterized protein n=1 Tax=Penicillium vulpinum TaxID=29845 RepID=A0A1V6QJV0_9EURO|nr:hypothetical protein PENVUL_c323G07959 [Penicillium vulpinum]